MYATGTNPTCWLGRTVRFLLTMFASTTSLPGWGLFCAPPSRPPPQPQPQPHTTTTATTTATTAAATLLAIQQFLERQSSQWFGQTF